MPDKTPPEESARHLDRSREAKRPVNDDEGAQAADRQPDDDPLLAANHAASKQEASANTSGDNNDDLSSKDRIALEPLTRAERFALFGLGATVVAAFATGWLAWSTDDMARSTRQLAHLAEQQAMDTQNALEISRRQAEAAERANDLSESAQISVAISPLPTPTVNSKLIGGYSAFNIGREPAVSVRTQASIEIVYPPRQPGSIAACSACSKSIVFPTQGFQGNSLAFSVALPIVQMTQEVVDQIKSGQAKVYLQGRVDFEDAKAHHIIFLCEYYKPEDGQLTSCAFGNSYTTMPLADWHDVTVRVRSP